MGRRIAAVDPVLCNPCVTQSRVGTHWSRAQYPRDALFKGRNIQELSVRNTSVGDTSTLHQFFLPVLAQNCIWGKNFSVQCLHRKGGLKCVYSTHRLSLPCLYNGLELMGGGGVKEGSETRSLWMIFNRVKPLAPAWPLQHCPFSAGRNRQEWTFSSSVSYAGVISKVLDINKNSQSEIYAGSETSWDLLLYV